MGYFGRRNISNPKSNKRILITGALGQIGTELGPLLSKKHFVVSSDLSEPNKEQRESVDEFVKLDSMDHDSFDKLVKKHDINSIVHLSALLSAVGEKNPRLGLDLGIKGTDIALDVGQGNGCSVFIPSSIGAFGTTTPPDMTPDFTIQRPTTVYGIGKVYAEHLGEYYHLRYGLDFRSLRYPGIISSETLPGGGTTDYAVAIFYSAVKNPPEKFQCYLREDSILPMMSMQDCLNSTALFLETPREKLRQCTYNVAGCSFTPKEIADEIRKHIPSFEIECNPDFRQQIADSWPNSLDDTNAQRDWGWKAEFPIDKLATFMLEAIKKRVASN